MKRHWPPFPDQPQGEVVARVGAAAIVKLDDARIEIQGGTDQDRAQAQDWVDRYWHQKSLRPTAR